MPNSNQEELARQREARKAEREAEQARKQADKDRRGVTPNEARPSKTQDTHGTSRVSRRS